MINRRMLLKGSAALLASPAIVEKVGAATPFDWQQAKGTHIEVNLAKGPRSDVLQKHQKEFEKLTGITVGSEQTPEQQQRQKAILELAAGRPSFDVLMVSLHVLKRAIGRGRWMIDMKPYLANPELTSPDYDWADMGAGGIGAATQADGRMDSLPLNTDFWIVYWNKALFAEKKLPYPKTWDEMLATAHALTDKAMGTYGFVGRGLKNANVPVWTSFLLGQDQQTVTPDGTKLLTDTPEAIWAAGMYQKFMRDTAPPGSIGFNWNECQTSFSQGKIGMWLDGVGFAPPLVDPTKSKIADHVGFGVVPAGPKARHGAVFTDAMGVPSASKKKTAAYLYCQWATSKPMMLEILRTGSGTPPRISPYQDKDLLKGSKFGQQWFDTIIESARIARPGLPEIVPVTEFRDVFGIALTNTISGADPATVLRKATAAFQPVLDKSNAT
jgi:multiple sugar transport system substrate-binding protein